MHGTPRQGERRVIRPRGFFALSFGSMVGSGWIILLGEWLRRAAPGGAMLALLAGGALMALIGTWCQPVLEKPGGIPLEWILMTIWTALGVVFSLFAASRESSRPE
jgi:hypothetical protein